MIEKYRCDCIPSRRQRTIIHRMLAFLRDGIRPIKFVLLQKKQMNIIKIIILLSYLIMIDMFHSNCNKIIVANAFHHHFPVIASRYHRTFVQSKSRQSSIINMIKVNEATTISSTTSNSSPSVQRKQYKHLNIQSDTIIIPKNTTAAKNTKLIQYYQQNISNSIISSFSINEPFNPLYKNNHIQTIGGFLLRNYGIGKYIPTNKNHWYIPKQLLLQLKQQQQSTPSIKKKLLWWDHREKINTPDGDWFHADFKYAKSQKTKINNNDDDDDDTSYDDKNDCWEDNMNWNVPTVILLHGLNSHSQSSLSIDMAKAYNNAGMNCICLNFRGCTDIPNDTLRFYHLGFTDDIQYFLQYINEIFHKRKGNNNDKMTMKSSPIFYLSGFSLGANVVLKCLGELGENALLQYNVYGASVLCAPLDSVRNSIQLSQPGINQQIYTKNLLNGLKQRAAIALERFCNNNSNTELFDYECVLQSKTITEFDDAFTSQIYKYDDCWDYYSQTSSIHYLDSIAIPTMILNSKDDPFFDSSIWPIEKSCLHDGGTKPLYFVQTNHGGHLGYSFHQISENDERNDNSNDKYTSIPCWASIQAANFIQHIQQHDNIKEIQRQKDYDLYNDDNTKISSLYKLYSTLTTA